MTRGTKQHHSINELNSLRRQAVELRLGGATLAETQSSVGGWCRFKRPPQNNIFGANQRSGKRRLARCDFIVSVPSRQKCSVGHWQGSRLDDWSGNWRQQIDCTELVAQMGSAPSQQVYNFTLFCRTIARRYELERGTSDFCAARTAKRHICILGIQPYYRTQQRPAIRSRFTWPCFLDSYRRETIKRTLPSFFPIAKATDRHGCRTCIIQRLLRETSGHQLLAWWHRNRNSSHWRSNRFKY